MKRRDKITLSRAICDMLIRRFHVAITLQVVAFLFIAFTTTSYSAVIHSRVLMGTIVEITFFDTGRFDDAAQAAFSSIKKDEALFSSYRPSSDISKINNAAGMGPVSVDWSVARVVKIALDVSAMTGGAFDPTFNALSGLWDFSADDPKLPGEAEVKARLPFLDYRLVSVDIADTSRATVGIGKEGMSISLGGIAKGHIVGRAASKLKEAGVRRAILKAGGDMFVFSPPGVKPFVIGIKHPRVPGKIFARLNINNGAVATSGDYERFFIKDGLRYHHIIDPATGFPARRSVSVTIISEDPTLADALSTSVFIMGPRRGMALVETIEGVEALIVAPGGRITVSSGLKGKVEFEEGPLLIPGVLKDIGE